jgi:hypothetical protein
MGRAIHHIASLALYGQHRPLADKDRDALGTKGTPGSRGTTFAEW